MRRPFGVTILAILQLSGSILGLMIGLSGLLFKDAIVQKFSRNPQGLQASSSVITFGVILLVLSLVGLLVAYGLFALKIWAWATTLLLQGLIILGNLNTLVNESAYRELAVLQLVISAAIVYYLLQPAIKRSFSR